MVDPSLILISAPEPVGVSGEVPPLFIGPEGEASAWDTLLSKLRLSGLPDDEDTRKIVAATLTKVRTLFYRRLGRTRIATLTTYRLVPNPVTEQHVLRSVAADCELAWMRMELLRVLRFATIDANSVLQQANDEGMTREAPGIDLENEIKRLQDEIERSLSFLSGSSELGEEQLLQATTIEPDTTYPIGSSLFH